MGRWFIVRHGETEWNAQGRIQGHTDISLSERGIQQAKLVAQRLAGVSLDVAYSSDLARSAETARQILDQRSIPLHTTSRLREFNKGVFEGLTPEETGQQYPELFEASQVNDLDFAPPGGESIRETSVRMNAIMTDLRMRHPDENVLIVGHGGALRAGLAFLCGHVGLGLIPLLLVVGLARRGRPGRWLLPLLIPLGIAVGYEAAIAELYDMTDAVFAAPESRFRDLERLGVAASLALVFVGGVCSASRSGFAHSGRVGCGSLRWPSRWRPESSFREAMRRPCNVSSLAPLVS